MSGVDYVVSHVGPWGPAVYQMAGTEELLTHGKKVTRGLASDSVCVSRRV